MRSDSHCSEHCQVKNEALSCLAPVLLQEKANESLRTKIFSLLPLLFVPPLSGLFLVLAFPMYDVGWLAWLGLAPLLVILNGKSPKHGFMLLFASSIVFYPGILSWLLKVPGYTLLHHVILAIYIGLYFGFFGLIFCFVAKRSGVTAAFLSTPFLWVSLEYIRSNMSFLATPWGMLAHSQYTYPWVIQVASITGSYGVSFLIVLANTALAAIIYPATLQLQKNKNALNSPPSRLGKILLVTVAAALIVTTLIYGHIIISQPVDVQRIKVSVVQGNIEQAKKWDRRYAKFIMKRYADLSLEASKDAPSLIIWPETTTPWSIMQDPRLHGEVKGIARTAGTYLLLGSSQRQKFRSQGSKKGTYYNSAFLIDPGKEMHTYQKYDKIRLFPFGEYLPMKETIPWSFINIPDVSGYEPGEEYTVFELPNFRFGVTICWENVFPDLVRQFVKRGAQFIVNITNEAWFGRTAAPYQFVSMSVFRAVENRVSVVRATNTGVSCFINPYGRITGRVEKNGKDIFIPGYLTQEIPLSQGKTFYTLHGDIFVYICLILTAVVILSSALNPREKAIRR